MNIRKIRIQQFRAHVDSEIEARFLTSFVGPNGAGKSSILHALRHFFDPKLQLTASDLSGNMSPDIPDAPDEIPDELFAGEIRVALDFEFPKGEVPEELDDYADGCSVNITMRAIPHDGIYSKSYFGKKKVHPAFRGASQLTLDQLRPLYKGLQEDEKYKDLPNETAKGKMLANLESWERENPEHCTFQFDDGKFFGVGPKFQGNIADWIRLVFVPAVRDASVDAGAKSHLLAKLNELATAEVIETEEIEKQVDDFRSEINEAIRPNDNHALAEASNQIRDKLQEFASNTDIQVDWGIDLDKPTLQARFNVIEDDFATSIEHAGHGVQRAVTITMLQHLDEIFSNKDDLGRRTILAIEEPELFQHPNRQRHFANILRRIAGSDGRPDEAKMQVFIATHSPLFVNLDFFDCVRRVTKDPGTTHEFPSSRIIHASTSKICRLLEAVHEEDPETFDEATLRARIRAIMTPWVNEGFFAQKICLVEGESDRAALLALAEIQGFSFESEGISIIPVNSKNNLDRPFLIFTSIGIPTYLVWDSDWKEGFEETEQGRESIRWNHALQRAAGEEEVADFPNGNREFYTCFHNKIETSLKEAAGQDQYRQAMDEAKRVTQISKDSNALKSPTAMKIFLEAAIANGAKFEILESVIENLKTLDSPTPL